MVRYLVLTFSVLLSLSGALAQVGPGQEGQSHRPAGQVLALQAAPLTTPSMLHNVQVSAPTGLSLYVLTGQSNISGRDTGYTVPSIYTNDPSFQASWVFNDTWHQARVRSDSSIGETRTALIDTDASVGINLSISLAIGRASATGQNIGIVTCARGGTSAYDWRTSGTLFPECVARIQAALPGNTLAGIAHYQAEADRNATFSDFVRFYQRTIDTMNGFRAAFSKPDLPVVIVGLGDNALTPGDETRAWQSLQELQKQVCPALGHCAYVSATGLPLIPGDTVHLSGASNLTLGTMVSEAFDSIE